jgi:hypothetical protein
MYLAEKNFFFAFLELELSWNVLGLEHAVDQLRSALLNLYLMILQKMPNLLTLVCDFLLRNDILHVEFHCSFEACQWVTDCTFSSMYYIFTWWLLMGCNDVVNDFHVSAIACMLREYVPWWRAVISVYTTILHSRQQYCTT